MRLQAFDTLPDLPLTQTTEQATFRSELHSESEPQDHLYEAQDRQLPNCGKHDTQPPKPKHGSNYLARHQPPGLTLRALYGTLADSKTQLGHSDSAGHEHRGARHVIPRQIAGNGLMGSIGTSHSRLVHSGEASQQSLQHGNLGAIIHGTDTAAVDPSPLSTLR